MITLHITQTIIALLISTLLTSLTVKLVHKENFFRVFKYIGLFKLILFLIVTLSMFIYYGLLGFEIQLR